MLLANYSWMVTTFIRFCANIFCIRISDTLRCKKFLPSYNSEYHKSFEYRILAIFTAWLVQSSIFACGYEEGNFQQYVAHESLDRR
jgi:hypothetical protein